MEAYKWHEESLRQLLAMRGRLAHALLIQAPHGTGLYEFASEWARCLLCENPRQDGSACGACAACRWFAQDNHPDYRLVQPESFAPVDEDAQPAKERKSDQIRIDQIRALQDFLAVGTHRAGSRVVLVHPADTMNPATQNALLKSLEEPPAHTVFILATSDPHRLLPTVRSRCRIVALPKPATDDAVEWLTEQGVREPLAALALAGGAPLLAVDLAGRSEFVRVFAERLGDRHMEPLALAVACQNAETAEFVNSLYRWCYDVLSLKLAGRVRYHRGRETSLQEIGARCRPERVAAFLRTLAEARALAQHPLNARLFFEDLLIRYQAAIEAPGAA